MAPVAKQMYEKAWVPYENGETTVEEAGAAAWTELRTFLVTNTRESELELFADMSGYEPPEDASGLPDRLLVLLPVAGTAPDSAMISLGAAVWADRAADRELIVVPVPAP